MSTLQDGTAKFNCDMCFTNYQDSAASVDRLSIPPDDAQYNTWSGLSFPHFFQEKAKKALQGLYGKEMSNVSISGYRLCW